ncbi:MAG: hypothetical protein HC918_13165 [Oscillatoriales cyanobacterium SM2_1_8]|nr:hypothetical protein [Oscillatoriales cyanobacterium SM2_1_8]
MSHTVTVELSDRAYGLLLLSEQPLAAALEAAVLAYYAGEIPPNVMARWQPAIEQAVQRAIAVNIPSPRPAAPAHPPQVHPLAVGDNVQIRDGNSPFFQAIVPVTAVGIIRATVRTEQGEQSFLKRDLRYIPEPLPKNAMPNQVQN